MGTVSNASHTLWGLATEGLRALALDGKPFPRASGTRQTFVARGLAPAAVHYFAVRSRDEAGNGSRLSNVAMGRTQR